MNVRQIFSTFSKNAGQLFCATALIVSGSIGSATDLGKPGDKDKNKNLNEWVKEQLEVSTIKLNYNISPADARPGAVIASPSRHDPNYYKHWIRDAALVMSAVYMLKQTAENEMDRRTYRRHLEDFVDFSEINQTTYAITGLGEPKFHVDGTSYQGPWGRPQNDGPALRALALIPFANDLLDKGEKDYVLKRLYKGQIPANTVIKRDLEYVAHHWQESNFDLWEEVKGDHFYTRMAQAHALLQGADLAERLGDGGAADYYRWQSNRIYLSLNSHRNLKRGHIVENINRVGGLDYKFSGLDSATVLSLNQIRNMTNNMLVRHSDPLVMKTFFEIEVAFIQTYSLNSRNSILGTAIGRYSEDRYYGGHPWFLTTLGFAEYMYRLYEEMHTDKKDITISDLNIGFWRMALEYADSEIQLRMGEKIIYDSEKYKALTSAMLNKAESFFLRVNIHKGAGGRLDEQFHRDYGYMLSARDLTWSYAAFITATHARQNALKLR